MNQTIQIETGKSIRFENVASFRKKMEVSEIHSQVGNFIQYLQGSGVQKNGSMISVTFEMEIINGKQVLDMEFLLPLNKSIDLSLTNYIFKPKVHIENAVYTRYIGNPPGIENTYNQLISYMKTHQMQQITSAYYVNINEANTSQEESIIDIYIGVNPNIV